MKQNVFTLVQQLNHLINEPYRNALDKLSKHKD